ncbi:DUF1800 domain-containing protein [Aquimarina sp. 2201CG14-23]|uniref:DUF1800 domain-containing protein n=1 Tax=Aquimarina mycalae TaxID=3040073 RepID=UPI002477ED48|nr:DUF1800 domain-containing protein [Aquimarina sp. 2201CG14-23]MDH7447482.1 DUF1800 domain-containing protein [Aquimarina sp. 2201CG14-23]
MISDTSCNLASLDPYVPTAENPWNVSRINHLYRRVAFGATKTEVLNALTQNDPSALVDSLIDQAIAAVPTPAPTWGFWNRDQFEAAEMANENNTVGFYQDEGKRQMIFDFLQNGLRDRLTLFWSNHFVTEDDTYRSPAYQYQYYNLLQFHALGDFRQFVYDIGISSAMLVYLNGDENTRDRPNENYARELYELFTLGVDNGYDENDIIETAKAITGWVETNDIAWGPITFNPGQFSNETKTIFGQSANFGYYGLGSADDVIAHLFTQRQALIANFICGKLYTYFVSPTCNEAIVAQMAQTFIDNNFQIAPVLRQLFKSQHFFDQEAIGAIIKSPIDLLVTSFNQLNFQSPPSIDSLNSLLGRTTTLGQEVLNPIDVEGWQGDEDWISPDYLIGRWEGIQNILDTFYAQDQAQFSNFLNGLPIGTLADGVVNNSLQGEQVNIVVKAILDYFLPRGLEDQILFEEALAVFKEFYPDNYYEPGAVAPFLWTLDLSGVSDQLYALLSHIDEVPEFQLK